MRLNLKSVHRLVGLPGLVHVTAEEGAPRHETSAVLVHAPGSARDGIAAGPAPAAEDIITAIAASRAQDTSKYISFSDLTKTRFYLFNVVNIFLRKCSYSFNRGYSQNIKFKDVNLSLN